MKTTGDIFQRFTYLYTNTGLPSEQTRTTYTPDGKPSNDTALADGTLSFCTRCPAKSKISTFTFLSAPVVASQSFMIAALTIIGTLSADNPALFSTLTTILEETHGQ